MPEEKGVKKVGKAFFRRKKKGDEWLPLRGNWCPLTKERSSKDKREKKGRPIWWGKEGGRGRAKKERRSSGEGRDQNPKKRKEREEIERSPSKGGDPQLGFLGFGYKVINLESLGPSEL